jgi:hypothetical protein
MRWSNGLVRCRDPGKNKPANKKKIKSKQKEK